MGSSNPKNVLGAICLARIRQYCPSSAAGRTIDEKRKWVGSLAVASKSGSRISRADKYARKGILDGPPGRHTGESGVIRFSSKLANENRRKRNRRN
jgi:hypothetical protein